jgi:capsular polysaccharide export protein
MNNVLYPLTYLGLGPYMIALARALQSRYGFNPTYLAVTPAEAAFARNNTSRDSRILALDSDADSDADVLLSQAEYESVYGFMKAKYGGSHKEWRDRVNTVFRCVERAIVERKITLCIVWNGSDCVGKVCQILAQKHALKILYLENGYFPNTLQIDPCGVNAEASICELSLAEWERAPVPANLSRQPIRPTPVVSLSLLQRAVLKCRSRLDRRFYSRYPELRDQQHAKRVKTSLTLSSTQSVLKHKKEFALIVLQVHDDTQLLLNSPLFTSPRSFLLHCYSSIREVFGPNYPIVVKLHPVDMDRVCYADLASSMHGVSWVGAEPVQPLLLECGFVMVINSSVGLQAIALHKPTLVFGDSFYSRSEVCSVVRSVHDTRVALLALKASGYQKDPGQIDRFIHYLTQNYFVPGSWSLKADSDLTPVINRIQWLLSRA